MRKTFILLATLCISLASCNSKEDKWLDAYEKYANETIAVAERVKNGDTSDMEQFKSLIEKGQELNKEFQDSKKNFSKEQQERFNQITAKITENTLSMANQVCSKVGETMDDTDSSLDNGFVSDITPIDPLLEESTSSDEENTASSSSSEDWDKILDSYEEYVEKYIVFMKKIAEGDMSAYGEYQSLLQTAEEYTKKLQDAGDNLSVEQLNRFNKISMKMLEAAQQ